MSGSAEMSTRLQENEPEVTATGGMKVALIGPNEAYRKIVAKALAGSEARSVHEFVDYPANLADLPAMLDQNFDVIMIDVDSDEGYAIKLVETVAGITNAVVMVYSRRNDPDLLMNCMRAGARDFLPLPQEPQADAGLQLVQPESHPEPRPVPPPAPQTTIQPEARPVSQGPSYTMAPPEARPVPPPAPQSFAAPPASLEPPSYVPPIDRGVPEQRMDEFPLGSSFAEMGQAHSLQQDIDEWDNAHLRAPEPSISHEAAAPRVQFAAPPVPVPSRPEPTTFRAPEPPKTIEEPFPIEAFLRNPEPARPVTPIESFLKVSEPPARPAVEPRRFESEPPPVVQHTEEAKAAAPSTSAPSTSFDEWDSAFLRTPQTSANKAVAASPRATVTSIPRPQPAPAPVPRAPEPVPAPAPRETTTTDLFAPAVKPDAATIPADTSILSASRPQIDRANIPMFQYEVPEEEKQSKSKMGLLLAVAGGVGLIACALAVFILRTSHHNDAPPQAQSQQVAQQQPVAPGPALQQAASTLTTAKPSAATPIAGAQTVTPQQPAAAAVSSGMMDAQLAAPSRIHGEVKAPVAVGEAPAIRLHARFARERRG